MKEKLAKWFRCFWHGHKWREKHGFYDEPAPGTDCLRCGKKYGVM